MLIFNKKSFTKKVLLVVKRIPRGAILTYGEVARRAGSPQAARAVGTILKKNYDSLVPCHRVIKANGSAGNYNRGGSKAKRLKLREEGVKI